MGMSRRRRCSPRASRQTVGRTADDVSAFSLTWARIINGVANNGDGLCINGTIAAWRNGTVGRKGMNGGNGQSTPGSDPQTEVSATSVMSMEMCIAASFAALRIAMETV